LGKDCGTPAELAREAGQSKNWDEALKILQRRYIQDWVKQDVRDFDLLSKLQDIEDDKNLDWEQRLCAALLVLDSELPLCWRGEIVTPDWMSAQAVESTQSLTKVLTLLASSLPEWLQRCRNQGWMLEMRQRRQRLQTEVGWLGLNLSRPDVDRVIFLPFEAVSTEANRRREAVYSPATEADQSLKSVLAKPQWNESECVAVVVCPFSRFLTKEQRWLEVKRAVQSQAENLLRRAKADHKISELQSVNSLLIELGHSLNRDFDNLSQPAPFERGDEHLQQRIREGSQFCQRRILQKHKAQRMIFVAGLSLTALCILLALHVWLLGRTSLVFAFSLDGKGFPVGKGPSVTVDGKPFTREKSIPLGHHQLAVTFAGVEPITKKFWSFYGKNDLGLLPLESSKGSLSVKVTPIPATVSVRRDGQVVKQADAPFKLAKIPVGEYSLVISRREYQEIHSVKIERERETEANIELDLGSAELSSFPADAEYELSGNGRHWQGKLPVRIDDLPVGQYAFTARRKAWELTTSLSVPRGVTQTNAIDFPYGSIAVTSEPTGLTISTNGVAIGQTPLTLRELKPGQYTITVTDGENDLSADITVGPKETTNHFYLFRYGTVQISSTPPGATVIRMGKDVGKTPLELQHLPTGESAVTLKLEGYITTNLTLLVLPDETVSTTSKLTSERYLSYLAAARNAAAGFTPDYYQALDSLTRAIAISPDDAEVGQLLEHYKYALDFSQSSQALEKNDLDGALTNINAALTVKPGDTEALNLRYGILDAKRHRDQLAAAQLENSSAERVIAAAKAFEEMLTRIANEEKMRPITEQVFVSQTTAWRVASNPTRTREALLQAAAICSPKLRVDSETNSASDVTIISLSLKPLIPVIGDRNVLGQKVAPSDHLVVQICQLPNGALDVRTKAVDAILQDPDINHTARMREVNVERFRDFGKCFYKELQKISTNQVLESVNSENKDKADFSGEWSGSLRNTGSQVGIDQTNVGNYRLVIGSDLAHGTYYGVRGLAHPVVITQDGDKIVANDLQGTFTVIMTLTADRNTATVRSRVQPGDGRWADFEGVFHRR
jgi:tetratricopeptide (TPR) repeat protein